MNNKEEKVPNIYKIFVKHHVSSGGYMLSKATYLRLNSSFLIYLCGSFVSSTGFLTKKKAEFQTRTKCLIFTKFP